MGVEVKRDAEADDARTVRPCRCVILTARALPRPTRLILGLEQRGAQVTLVHDAPSLMVELAQRNHVAIVNEPQTVRRLDELLAAVERYYPSTPCWQYEAIGFDQPRLLRIDKSAGDADAAKPTDAASPSGLKGVAPANGSAQAGASDKSSQAVAANAPSLTASAAASDHDRPAANTGRGADGSAIAQTPDASKERASSDSDRVQQGHPQTKPPGDALVTLEELTMLLMPLDSEGREPRDDGMRDEDARDGGGRDVARGDDEPPEWKARDV